MPIIKLKTEQTMCSKQIQQGTDYLFPSVFKACLKGKTGKRSRLHILSNCLIWTAVIQMAATGFFIFFILGNRTRWRMPSKVSRTRTN